jgi:phospholipase/lecithinase/hemolysin
LGERTIIVMNLIPLGCTPGFLSLLSASNTVRNSNGCIASINSIVDLHNTELRRLIGDLRKELALPNLVLFDANAIYTDAVRHPSKYGIEYTANSYLITYTLSK